MRRPGRRRGRRGVLRAFYQRVANRRGVQVAVVATARKLVVVCWHLVNSGHKRRSKSSRRIVPAKRSAMAFARGARTGS